MQQEPYRVPRLWPDSTIVCLGCGPSLTQEDVLFCRDKAHVIAIKDTWHWAPWAEALYSCDGRWWDFYKGLPAFGGLKFGLTVDRQPWPNVNLLANTGIEGLELDPTGLRNGRNSGYQAINLAVHLGARRIVLLGYDMQPAKGRTHFAGADPSWSRLHSPYPEFVRCFGTLIEPLRELGIEVFNCSRRTALEMFPRGSLEEVLTSCEVAA